MIKLCTKGSPEKLRGLNLMRKIYMKTASALLAAAILGTIFACGCAGKNNKGTTATDGAGLELNGKMPEKLPDGLSWYDFKEDKEIFAYLDDQFEDCFVSDVTVCDGRTWVYVYDSGSDIFESHVMSFDKDGNVVTDFTCQDVFSDDISLDRMTGGSGIYLYAYDFSKDRELLYPIDTKTGRADPSNSIDMTAMLPSGKSVTGCAFAGSDLLLLASDRNSSVMVADPATGSVKKDLELKDFSKTYKITFLEGIMAAGSDKAVVWGNTSSNMYFGRIRYVVVDLETGEEKALDELTGLPLHNLSSCGDDLVTVTDEGVYRIDPDSGETELAMPFNCSNCNRFLVNNSDLCYADDDTMVFYYSSRNAGPGQISNAVCYFTKTDTYPASGKDILTVASTEDLDYSISEAIMLFNSQSSTSYMMYDGRYKANTNIDYSNTDNADKAALDALTSYGSVSDRLAMDLMSGTGPDIIITGGANEQLSRGEYFLDLSDYIKSNSSINEETYFVNAFEAMKYNGALYQLPIGFYVDGFISSSENFGGRNGMTFDEYTAMVKDVCNGNDPLFDHQLSYSRTEVATKLFANTSEMFIADGRIDVNNEAFKAILDYCKDLPAKAYYDGKDLDMEFEDYMSAKDNMPVQPDRFRDFQRFEEFSMRFENVSFCGYPSIDGRSASVGSDLAVSVSAQSSDPDSCKEFIGILLSDDIQHSLTENIPVNKKCARELFIEEIEDHNRWHEKGYGSSFFAGTGKQIDPAVADRYIGQLSEATTSSFVYHNISLIIYEEVPAYFEGQKSFDDVCAAINNRAQTVLDERK